MTEKGSGELIVLENVTRWYGQVIGVNNISFSVGPGVTGLLGPNGAGKSTIMKMVTGQILPNQGDVRLCDRSPFHDRTVRRNLGYVPEADVLPNWDTGMGFLTKRAMLRGYGAREAQSVAREALDAMRLLELAGKKRIHAYSRGMRQRLKLAQALFHSPGILILDEPLTGMDPVGRREVIDLIRKLGAKGHCILVSSHILHEVEAMTDNVILIARGKIVAMGTISHIRGLIDQHPHSIEIRTPHPRRLAVRLIDSCPVVNVSLEEDEGLLTVRTRDPDRFYSSLGQIASDGELVVESFYSPDNNLQAVFNYLVK